jgi:nucleotide-binding universal stress UspA family protein
MSDPAPTDAAARQSQVLVGFDGSAQARSALRFAAEQALRRDAPLTVVTAYTVPPAFYPNIASMPSSPEDAARKEAARRTLEEAAEILQDHRGELLFRSAEGDAAGVLVDLSAQAQLVVVGARGRGGFAGRILGSVASALPAHSRCPTVVVPGAEKDGEQGGRTDPSREPAATDADKGTADATADAPVVAGVDGSDQSRAVLAHAAEEAERRGTVLRVLVAMPLLDEWMFWYPQERGRTTSVEDRREELQRFVEDQISGFRAKHRALPVEVVVEVGNAIQLIAEASGDAQLTVVGTRGRGTLKSALMGSVSRGVLDAAEGPVMVVPAADPAGRARPSAR